MSGRTARCIALGFLLGFLLVRSGIVIPWSAAHWLCIFGTGFFINWVLGEGDTK